MAAPLGGDVIVGGSSDSRLSGDVPLSSGLWAARSSGAPHAGLAAQPRRGLVAACLRGDQNAWETLVRSHAGLVYAVIRRCGFDGDEAADLFQEVWMAAWDGLGSIRDERALAGWLATIAARRAKRALLQRAQQPTRTTADVPERPDPDPLPDEVVIDRERGSAIRAAVEALSERDRRIVQYFFYDATAPSYSEIAARLGVAPDTIGSLRTRCLRRLREALGGAAGGDLDADEVRR